MTASRLSNATASVNGAQRCGLLLKILLGTILLSALSGNALADSAPGSGVLQLSRLVTQARSITPCSASNVTDTKITGESIGICDFLSLFDHRKSDSPRRDGPTSETVTRAIQSAQTFLQSTSVAEEIKARAKKFEDQLSKGSLPAIPGLTLVPQEFCVQIGKDAAYCSVPACLIGNDGAEGTAKCPMPPLALSAVQIADAGQKWYAAKGGSSPCRLSKGTAIGCLPIDSEAVAIRDYLLTVGKPPLLSALRQVEQSGDVNAVVGSIKGDLQCWVDRHAALTIAEAAQDSLSVSPDLSAKLTTVMQTIRHSGEDAQRAPGAQCVQADVNRVYDATLAALQYAVESAAKERVASTGAKIASNLQHGEVRCGPDPAHPEQLYEFPQSSTGIIKGIRLRPSSSADGRTDAILVVRDPAASAKTNSLLCAAGEYELNLGIPMDVEWIRGVPQLKGRFGQIAFGKNGDMLAVAISQILPVKGLYIRATGRPGSGILPIAVEASLKLPGISTLVELPTFELRPTLPQYGLDALLAPEKFRAILNDALQKQLAGPIAITSLGVTVHSLKLIETKGDQAAANFSAIATIPALHEYGDGIPIEIYIGPSSDPSKSIFVLRPAVLPPRAIEGISKYIKDNIDSLLTGLPGAADISRLDTVRLTGASLGQHGITVDVSLSFPGTSLQPLPISLAIDPNNSNLGSQVGQQLGQQSARMHSVLQDYAKQLLSNAAQQLADPVIAKLKAQLPKSYSFFGLQWEIQNVHVDAGNARALCFDLQDSSQRSIHNICAIGLDAQQTPQLSWDRASIDSHMLDWLRGIVNGLSRAPYFDVALISAALQDSKIVINTAVRILDTPSSVPVRVELSTKGANLALGTDAIIGTVIGAVRSQAVARLKGLEISIGQFSLSNFTLPDRGTVLAVGGSFSNGDFLSGTVEIDLYPKFQIHKPEVNLGAAIAKLVGFNAGAVSIESVSVDPVAVRAAVQLSKIPFLSDAGVALPAVHIEVPMHGTPRVIEPIEFPVPGDIPIPPYFTLTNSSIALYPQTKPLTFIARTDFTVATGAISNIIKIRAELTANLSTLRFDFAGPMTVLNTIELARTDGTLDVKAGMAHMQSQSSGWVKQLVATDTQSVLDGPGCRFTEDASGAIPAIKVSVNGHLAIQAPCGRQSAECPSRGLGSACISGDVQLGPLGDAQGQVGASLDFRSPVAGVRVHTLDLGIAKPSIDVKVAAHYSRAAFDAGPISVTVYAPSITDISPDLLRRLLEEALKPHFSLEDLLSGKIVLSLLPASSGSGDPDSDFDQAAKQTAANPSANSEAPASAAPSPSSVPAAALQASPGGGSPPPSIENVLVSGPWSVVYTNAKREKAPPFIWRHWVRSNPAATDDSIWFMNEKLGSALTSPSVWPIPETVRSSSVLAVPDAIPGDPKAREYQIFLDKKAQFCPSGICTAAIDAANPTIKDIANDTLMHTLFSGTTTSYGDYAVQHPSLFSNPARKHVLNDLVTAAWEGSPNIQSLRCIVQTAVDCTAYLLEGLRRTDNPNEVPRWLYATDLVSDYAWFIQKDSLVDISLVNTPTKIMSAALTGTTEITVIGRSASSAVVRYQDPDTQDDVLALWDLPAMTEVRRIPITGSQTWRPFISGIFGFAEPEIPGQSITDSLALAASGTFGQALIDYLKAAPATKVTVSVRRTDQSDGLLFRDVSATNQLVYFSVARTNSRDPLNFVDTHFCIRTGDTNSVLTALTQRRERMEVPKDSPTDKQLAFDYVAAYIGVDSSEWREKGFLANPTSLLTVRKDLPTGVCSLQ
jgi:hypothetical protein